MIEEHADQSVEERLDGVNASERQAALRALLYQPLLSARDSSSEKFVLVRRHAAWLREWLADNCGWTLHLDSEFARLQKTPPDTKDGTRGAVEAKSDMPFNRRKYVLLCLALATVERGDRQTTLGNLAKQIISLISADAAIAKAGIAFNLESRDQRSELVQVVRYLLELRILERVDGDELLFLNNASDVLYNVNRPILAVMLNVRRGPSTLDVELPLSERMKLLIEEQRPDTDDGTNRELRIRITRRLLDDPVIYFDDLDAAELDYLNKQRGRLLRKVEEATGLIPEVRAEGIAMVDDCGDLTDMEIPKDGTEGHFTLLIAEHLAKRLKENRSCRVGIGGLHEHASMIVREHSMHWRRSVLDAGAVEFLVADALERLEGLRLIVREENVVIPCPAIARYRIAELDAEVPESIDHKRTPIQKTMWGTEP